MNSTIVVLWCAHQWVSRERALAGLVYAQKNNISRIILSGGLGEDGKSEAEMMQNIILWIHKNLWNKIEFILESDSINTQENLENINIVEDGDFYWSPQKYILISSKSQLFRLRNELPWMKRISSEKILSERLWSRWKTHIHHIVYWFYEIIRPIRKVISKTMIEKVKYVLKKA